jgi:hypothetical protein
MSQYVAINSADFKGVGQFGVIAGHGAAQLCGFRRRMGHGEGLP